MTEPWEPTEVADLLAEEEPEYVWLIPNLLEEKDRVIVTGNEGLGKSTLIRQFGWQVACGISPFTLEEMEPQNVLLLDFENPRRLIKRALRRLYDIRQPERGRLNVLSYPSGMDFTSPADCLKMQTDLALTRPKLVLGGPMYKMAPDLTTEEVSAALQKQLDLWREQFGFAIVLEAHQPQETITQTEKYRPARPYGCYSADTEALTRDGWKFHDQIQTGEEVLAFDPETGQTTWQRVEAVHNYPYQGQMLHIQHRSLDMMVTPNHRMLVGTKWWTEAGSRAWEIKEAADVPATFEVPYASSSRDEGEVGEADFMRFLGWWLAEGSLNDWGPCLTQAEGPLAQEMRETVTRLGYDFNVWTGGRPTEKPCMQMRLRGQTTLGHWLAEECGEGSAYKHIPDMVWFLNNEAREVLLMALMEGDGSWKQFNAAGNYYTTSPRLADDVQRLAISVGYAARLKVRPPGKTHHMERFTVEIHNRESLWIKPHCRSWEGYTGNVVCLTVPSGAYVTRRRGYMAIAGNSSLWRRWPEFGLCLFNGGRLFHWRGDREEREWPEQMRWGGEGEWPWMVGVGRCLHCNRPLAEGQEKYCDERCGNAHRQARWRANRRN